MRSTVGCPSGARALYMVSALPLLLIPEPALPQSIVTVAGGEADDGMSATTVHGALNWPEGVAVDEKGNVFISSGGRIRSVDAQTGIINAVEGSDSTGIWGDGGSAMGAGMSYPGGVALDRTGNMFVADTGKNRIRRVDRRTAACLAARKTRTSIGSRRRQILMDSPYLPTREWP